MLKGYLKCTQIDKMLIQYIHFELSKKDMSNVAIHLRNCPKCMEEYSKLQKRKKELKEKMNDIEKTLRMRREISEYIDNEANIDTIFIVEGMILSDKNYKKELIQMETLRRYLLESRNLIKNNNETKISTKIIAEIKNKKLKREKVLKNITQLFRFLHRSSVKS